MPPRLRRKQLPPPPPPPRFNPFTFQEIGKKVPTDAEKSAQFSGELAWFTGRQTPEQRRASLGLSPVANGFTGAYTTMQAFPDESPRALAMADEIKRRQERMDALVEAEIAREDRARKATR